MCGHCSWITEFLRAQVTSGGTAEPIGGPEWPRILQVVLPRLFCQPEVGVWIYQKENRPEFTQAVFSA